MQSFRRSVGQRQKPRVFQEGKERSSLQKRRKFQAKTGQHSLSSRNHRHMSTQEGSRTQETVLRNKVAWTNTVLGHQTNVPGSPMIKIL